MMLAERTWHCAFLQTTRTFHTCMSHTCICADFQVCAVGEMLDARQVFFVPKPNRTTNTVLKTERVKLQHICGLQRSHIYSGDGGWIWLFPFC